MRDEGGCVDIAVSFRSLLKLKHARFHDAARVVADTGDAEVEDRQDAFELTMECLQRLEIPRSLP